MGGEKTSRTSDRENKTLYKNTQEVPNVQFPIIGERERGILVSNPKPFSVLMCTDVGKCGHILNRRNDTQCMRTIPSARQQGLVLLFGGSTEYSIFVTSDERTTSLLHKRQKCLVPDVYIIGKFYILLREHPSVCF